jgi:D-erythrulose 4-kinase
MAYIYNRSEDFADEAIEGFVTAYPQFVSRVAGGVVRATPNTERKVAVVIGGGSGHYPAFAGLVGPGLAAGAATGNVFASPSAQQVYSVSKAVEAGRGVLLSYGNYAGDILNFDQAADRLVAEGVPCKSVVVTDDVLSAGEGEESRRRGIAGGLIVYKVAGAAADAGASLNEVARLAGVANTRTRTVGLAFSGCTLPGSTRPLFSVPDGVIEVGMGVHGEPGISRAAMMSADDLAETLVTTLVGTRPKGVPPGGRMAVILNGLGSVKYEELFVLYRSVARQLGGLGMTAVGPEIGEFVTSFEMAGVSLTLCWLDDELERLWMAPTYTPAFRKIEASDTSKESSTRIRLPEPSITSAKSSVTTARSRQRAGRAAAGRSSQHVASLILDALITARDAVRDRSDELGRLDAVAGDGDHGIGMDRGITAAADAAQRAVLSQAGAGTTLTSAGDAWANRAGGTSGVLWGLALQTFGKHMGDDGSPSPQSIARACTAAARALADFGKASLGEKTMLDALIPFAKTFSDDVEDGEQAHKAWEHASAVAEQAAADTANLVPQIGRARLHGQKSIGFPDPGATSFALIVSAVVPVLKKGCHSGQR